ncbi:MAG: hypothetical protein EA397_01755 [Deltaproteobacteria bacterium]|nr:MAG: hypothetical protein EA397_01755 [Deltaproteobacteria bacterium]
MSFLDRFDQQQRSLFYGVSTEILLDRGEYLMRRGEPGGDVFIVEDGSLEIVDARATPESILAVLQPGAVVGEGSFLDDAPRSADARAQTPIKVRRWAKDDLAALLSREPRLAATFYENLARTTSARLRNQNQSTLATLAGRDGAMRAGVESLRAEVLTFANRTKESLIEAETALRQDTEPRAAKAALSRTMNKLERWIDQHFTAHPEPDLAQESARVLSRELHPYLVRSALAERSIRRSQGVAGVTEVLAHVLVNTASGDGEVGALLDRWLLDRPSFQAMRTFRDQIVPLINHAIPVHRNRRLTLLNAGTGSLVARLVSALDAAPTVLSVVDQSREALAVLDASTGAGPMQVEIAPVQTNLVELSLGRVQKQIPPQDAIICHGLIEYMPDRIALGLLSQIVQRLERDGSLFLATLLPSADRHLLDRLLGWPTVRRRPERLARLLERAGLSFQVIETPAPLLMVCAQHLANSDPAQPHADQPPRA